ncbi:MAG TPA: DEAD/DEAH box helicase, partial [Candidatus Sulfotelmatobacter sp.]|nr:DEAD/DEAH box helicase [Candidatus Sulfotelmatobacter sp.]
MRAAADILHASPTQSLPASVARWFASRGWQPHAHQLETLAATAAGESVLLIAPTGGGKTLAGFLPALVELAAAPQARAGAGARRTSALHTLYISPLKALAVDVARNLQTPIAEMGLPISVETRTGDTPPARRTRQRIAPPDMLLTTPEQLALMLSYRDTERLFGALRLIVIDELHALVGAKRGDLLALGLARLGRIAPAARRIGLSATVAAPDDLRRYLLPAGAARLVQGRAGAPPEIAILSSTARIPWSGHTGRHAYAELYAAIQQARTALVFVNTRSQAEMVFQSLWRLNEANLP